MPIALKDLSLNTRLDKLEDELRVMLLFSSKEKNKCQDEHVSCDCLGSEDVSNFVEECKCAESPCKPIQESKMPSKSFRSRSAPEKRRTKRRSLKSPDKDSPKRALDKILQIFQSSNEMEKKKKRHCICENSADDCCKEKKENKENLKPIDIRTPPRKLKTKTKHREKKKINNLTSSLSDTVSYEIPDEDSQEKMCCCSSRPLCPCETASVQCPKRTVDLEIEISTLRNELSAITSSKTEADILKQKYDELQCCKMQFELQLQQLRKENYELAENLRAEKNIHVAKIDEVQSEAKVLVNKIRSEEDKLVKDLESKNNLIVRLSNATDELTKSIHEKEEENCAMNCKIREIETTTKLATEKINLLKNTNRQLARSVLDKHHSLQNCQSKTCKFKREVKEYKAKVEQSLQEIKRLQDGVGAHACVCGKRSVRSKVFCQEVDDTNTVRDLVNKISSLENIQMQNIAKMAKKNKVLQSGFDNLFQLMTCGDNAKRNNCCKCQELKDKCQEYLEKTQELKGQVKSFKCKEKQRHCERQELKILIEELTLLIKKQKERLQEFQELNDKQAQMLIAQEAVIASHNEQVTLIEMENQIIKRKCNDLEKDIKERKENLCSPLKKQLEQYRLTLADDKDSLKIKEKIIEDQVNTINDLKKKLQTNSGVTMNIMNQGLNQQQQLKKAMQDSDEKIRTLEYENSLLRADIQDIGERKTKLEAQIQAIDSHLIREYRTQADQLERQKAIIADLRCQMTQQIEEHELQMAILAKDANCAKMTARYATQKLEDTLRDFQKQTNSQMQVRDLLTGLLRDKDSKLKNAIVKMSSLTFDPISIASAISRQKPTNPSQEISHFLNMSDFESYETRTKMVTIVDETPTSDFQLQLRQLVPSELYTNSAWGRKKERELNEINAARGVTNKGGGGLSCQKEGCFPTDDMYCSGASGSTSGTGTSSGCTSSHSSENARKKGNKTIVLSPYIEDDEPTYIYVPKFRPPSSVSPFEPPQAFVPKGTNVVPPAPNKKVSPKVPNCYGALKPSRTVCVDNTCPNKHAQDGSKKQDKCTCFGY